MNVAVVILFCAMMAGALVCIATGLVLVLAVVTMFTKRPAWFCWRSFGGKKHG